jgi:histidinol-phosphate/aromatic aminotransferase/cobyric acid decarboxylase-like protein
VVAGASRQGFTLPTITKVFRKQGKAGSSWVMLSNGRDEFLFRVIRVWLGQGRRFLILQPRTPLQEFLHFK